jgi:hypothetical protein
LVLRTVERRSSSEPSTGCMLAGAQRPRPTPAEFVWFPLLRRLRACSFCASAMVLTANSPLFCSSFASASWVPPPRWMPLLQTLHCHPPTSQASPTSRKLTSFFPAPRSARCCLLLVTDGSPCHSTPIQLPAHIPLRHPHPRPTFAFSSRLLLRISPRNGRRCSSAYQVQSARPVCARGPRAEAPPQRSQLDLATCVSSAMGLSRKVVISRKNESRLTGSS